MPYGPSPKLNLKSIILLFAFSQWLQLFSMIS